MEFVTVNTFFNLGNKEVSFRNTDVVPTRYEHVHKLHTGEEASLMRINLSCLYLTYSGAWSPQHLD